MLCLFWLTSCFGQTPVTFRYFYYASGELFRVIDSTGTLIEYIIDPAGNVTQINRSTIAPGAPGILNLSSLSGTWGSTLTIYGQNFSSVAANNVVQINGVTVTVLSATATQLVVVIGPNATTGQVTVTVNGATAGSGTLIYTVLGSPYTQAFTAIFSVQNGAIPGSVPPSGQNEVPFRVFSVLNGSLPGSSPAAGQNEVPFRVFSVLNGTALGSIPAVGQNESVFPIFSVGNSTSYSHAIPSSPKPATVTASRSNAAGTPHVLLSRTSATAGQTIQIAATVDSPAPGTAVEFFVNGQSFGTWTAPYGFPLTVPYTVSALRVTAVTHSVTDSVAQDVSSEESAVGIGPESRLRLHGRVLTGDGAPAPDKALSLLYSGLRAEIFHFDQPLREMPDMTGLTPLAERAVSSLDMRNPGGVFGKDPLATGLTPDFAIRFTASLDVAQDGDYVFSLRGQEGVALRIDGQLVTDGARIRLNAGTAQLEALAFAGVGAMEIQLLWQPPGQLMQAVPDGVLWSREPALRAVTDLSGAFEFSGVPSSLGLVKVKADDIASGPVAASAGDIGVLTLGKAVR